MSRFSRRRLLLCAPVLLLPAAARAQPAERVHRVVYLTSFGPQPGRRYTDSLKDVLRAHGYVEGRNLVFERRHVSGDSARLPELARQVAAEAPDVIVTAINIQTRAARDATRTIPIVMVVGTDVMKEGFVESFARPGGNVTGVTWDAGSVVATKRLEFLREMVPGLRRVAALLDTGQDAYAFRDELRKVVEDLGLEAVWLEAQEDLEALFARAVREGAQGLVTGGGARLFRWRREVVALAARYRLPDAHYDSAFVEAGGLMSYAPSLAGLFAKAGEYVARILQGADPAALPVEQPTHFDLVINLETARAFGLAVPQSLLLRADRLVGGSG